MRKRAQPAQPGARSRQKTVSDAGEQGYSAALVSSFQANSRRKSTLAIDIHSELPYPPPTMDYAVEMLAPHEVKRNTEGVRDFVVFTVPVNLLEPSAQTYGDFDLTNKMGLCYSRILSFLIHSLYVARMFDYAQYDIYVEALVIDLDKVKADPDNTVRRSNLAGYRLWIFTNSSAYSLEVLLRRALFRTQKIVKLINAETLNLKLAYSIIADDAERTAAIRADTPKVEHAKEREDEDAELAEQRRNDAQEKANAKRVTDVEHAIAHPPVRSSAADAYDVSNDRASQFISINTMHDLLARVCLPMAASAAVPFTKQEEANAYSSLTRKWAESKLFDAEPPGSLFAALSPSRLFSFSFGLMVLIANRQRPCTLQLDGAAYRTTATGRLSFPEPCLVRQINSVMLEPTSFFAHPYPWTVDRFRVEMDKLRTRYREKRHAAEIARAPTDAASNAWAIGMWNAIAITFELHVQLPEDSEAQVHFTRVASDFDRNLDIENDPLILARADSDRYTATTEIIGALSEISRRQKTLRSEAKRIVSLLASVDGVDEGCSLSWTQRQDARLNMLRIEQATDEIMRCLNSAPNVSEQHRAAYRKLSSIRNLLELYQPSVSGAQHMTEVAGAIVYVIRIAELTGSPNTLQLLDLIFVMGAQAARVGDKEELCHTVLYGAPAIGKSHNARLAAIQALPGTMLFTTHASSKAGMGAQFDGGHVDARDEAPPMLTDHRPEAVRGSEAERAQLKEALTENFVSWDRMVRNEETNRYFTERVRAERIRLLLANANQVMFGALYPTATPPDRALVSRMDIVPIFPPSGSNLQTAVEAAIAPRSAAVDAALVAISEEQRKLLALIAILVALTTANVISVNTEVGDSMLLLALKELAQYAPALEQEVRRPLRAESYAKYWCFTTTLHGLFLNEGSPLRNRADRITLTDLPLLVAPHLYMRYDHGLWAVQRQLLTWYPFECYMVLRVLASVFCGFRRADFFDVYRSLGVPLIDDRLFELWAARSVIPDVKHPEPLALPLFIQELLRIEAQLDSMVPKDNYKFCISTSANAAEAKDADGNSKGAAHPHSSRDTNSVPGGSTPKTYQLEPTWLDTGYSPRQFWDKAESALRSHMVVEAVQVQTVFDQMLSQIRLVLPHFEPLSSNASRIGLSDLRFAHVRVSNEASKVEFHGSPLLRISEAYTHTSTVARQTVQINTAALMLPPQYMFALALCAAESKMTRKRECVLLLRTRLSQSLLQGWQVRPRADRDVVRLERARGVDLQGGAQVQTAARYTSDPIVLAMGTLAEAASANTVYKDDIEEEVYKRHIASLDCDDVADIVQALCNLNVPAYADLLGRAQATLSVGGVLSNEDHAAIMALYADHHNAAPQKTTQERIAAEQNQRSADVYPASRLSALDAHTHLMRYIAKEPAPLGDADTTSLQDLESRRRELEAEHAKASVDNGGGDGLVNLAHAAKASVDNGGGDSPAKLARAAKLKKQVGEARTAIVMRKIALVFPPQPDDVRDVEQCLYFEWTVHALCIILCMPARHFETTKVLCNLLEWRHLFQMVFALVCQEATPEDPRPITMTDEEYKLLSAGEHRIPGYKHNKPLTFATLRWLERALETRRMLDEAARVQAYFGGEQTLARSLELASRPELLQRVTDAIDTAIHQGTNIVLLSTYFRAQGCARRVKALWMAEQFGAVERESANEMDIIEALKKPRTPALAFVPPPPSAPKNPAPPSAALQAFRQDASRVTARNGVLTPAYFDVGH